jgi:NAD(P)-dependent dehydrogenase (short-subunit alcohol dehydrogenase family)
LVAQGWDRIVNVTTSHTTMVMQCFSPYGPPKAAIEAASVIWARNLAGTEVTVNLLAPGGAGNTRMVPHDEAPDRSKLVQPEVMMPPIVWLMSSQSDGVTGWRFIAKDWDAALEPAAAATKAGALAGWPLSPLTRWRMLYLCALKTSSELIRGGRRIFSENARIQVDLSH